MDHYQFFLLYLFIYFENIYQQFLYFFICLFRLLILSYSLIQCRGLYGFRVIGDWIGWGEARGRCVVGLGGLGSRWICGGFLCWIRILGVRASNILGGNCLSCLSATVISLYSLSTTQALAQFLMSTHYQLDCPLHPSIFWPACPICNIQIHHDLLIFIYILRGLFIWRTGCYDLPTPSTSQSNTA